ncbi:unnamed protein product [Adineta steineri]|uniref:Uncharacterized protein n=1 Tax=Adineta steineri TaxID=433720 RepID=A0A816A5K4_9BILA|nr:unnamed protein product [Adineta steineri]CAF1678517.1 unnamed protein product [Adineta steineri]
MTMFINGLKYITTCQSRFSRKSIDDIVTEQYKNISTIAFQALELIFHKYQFKNVLKKLKIRAQREYKIVQYVQRLIRQRSDIVIRRTDKRKVFYIGKAADFERKAEEYVLKTEAYEEIKNELGYYHGIPKPHKPETPLQPIVASIHAPATLVSKFLNDILAPIYLKVTRKYTFINDIDKGETADS